MTTEITITTETIEALLNINATWKADIRRMQDNQRAFERIINTLRDKAVRASLPIAATDAAPKVKASTKDVAENQPDVIPPEIKRAWDVAMGKLTLETIPTHPHRLTYTSDNHTLTVLAPAGTPLAWFQRHFDHLRTFTMKETNPPVYLIVEADPAPAEPEASESPETEAMGRVYAGADGKPHCDDPLPPNRRDKSDGQAMTTYLANADKEREEIALKELLAEVSAKHGRPTAGEPKEKPIDTIPNAAGQLTSGEVGS